MKKSLFRCFVAIILTISIGVSLLFSPAFAFSYTPDTNGAVEFDSIITMAIYNKYAETVHNVGSQLMIPHINYCTPEEMYENIAYYDTNFWSVVGSILGHGITVASNDYLGKARVAPDPERGVYRLQDTDSGAWIVRSDGEYPYCLISEWNNYHNETGGGAGRPDGGNTPAQDIYTKPGTANKFVGVRSVDQNSPVIVSYDVLSAACVSLNDQGIACSIIKMPINGVKFYVIYQLNSSDGSYYCNSASRPFVANIEPTVTDNKFDYIVNDNSSTDNSDNSTTINDSQIIDLTNGVLNMITENGDRISYNIDDVTYNFDNRSYTVNAYDYTYNTTNNYYEFNYYTYNISYTYNNTYVTYIGSTAEYQPTEYELYYELPDGRSSADLTAEDIAGLSFQFYDCMNYKRSATDLSLRALYHFDGDTEDASYWSTQGSFTWQTGSSITYMESNAFKGALYLDEKAHQFTVELPSNIGSQDFTVQWRYYQNSATTSTHNENYIMNGGTKLLGWSEQYLYNGSGSQLAGLSVGSWQELALVRDNGTLYIYHNGVRVGSVASSGALGNSFVFYFGPNSRAYSMIDELRVVNFAVAKGGAAYTPTSVPYDTNAVLVLPDSALPVADEFWKFDPSPKHTPVYKFNFTDGSVKFKTYGFSQTFSSGTQYYINDYSYIGKSNLYYIDGSGHSLSSSGLSISGGSGQSLFYNPNYGGIAAQYSAGPFFIPYSSYPRYGTRLSGSYTVTALFTDGTQASGTFTAQHSQGGSSDNTASALLNLSAGSNSLYFCYYDHYNSVSGSMIQSCTLYGNADVVYLEVVPGTEANTGHEWISAVYSTDELKPNTAAVQSMIPVNKYTVGGVRPTFPARGDVWFPVNGSRISGCYIYNGRAWEETNARWYTGKRWIPIYAFDIVTLEDMWDIADAPDVVPSINSEQGFWNWWQKEWLDFRAWLAGVFSDSSGGGSGGGDTSGGGIWNDVTGGVVDGISALVSGIIKVITDILSALLSLVTDLLTSIFSFLTDTVLGSISSFFASFKDGSLFEFFQPNSEGGGAALPEGVASVFAFFSGVVMLLPPELRTLLIFGIAALILISVFKMVKS